MSRSSRVREAEYVRDERRPRVPETSEIDSRVYIGGLSVKNFSFREIDSWMGKYGKVMDIAFFERHILVQFDRESEATKAIDREKGETVRGARFDIRFAHSSDGSMVRTDLPRSRSPRDIPYDCDPRDISPHRVVVRDRSPEDRNRYYKERRPNSPTDYRNYERPKNPADERPRNAIDERSRGSKDERPRSNIRQEYMDNEVQDATWNGPPATIKVPVERPNFDAAIVVMSSDLLNYAETIESKFQRQIPLTTHIIVLKEEGHANACIDDLEKKGVLYAILVNQMNEKLLSCTLRILHGTGQEHRNMLLTNALTFVARNFEEYQKQHRDLKAIAPKPNYDPSRMPPGFMAPDDKIIYQLHLLADSRMLTLDELNEVDEFIQRRIQVLEEAEGIIEKGGNALLNSSSKDMVQGNANLRDDNAIMPGQLSSKILNILKPGQSHMVASGMVNQELLVANNDHANAYHESVGVASNPFQNAKVQQALDSLMQSKFRPEQVSEESTYQAMLNQAQASAQYLNPGMNRVQNPMNVAMRGMQPAVNPYANPFVGFYPQQPPQQQQPQMGQAMFRPRPQQFQANRAHFPGY